MNKPLESTLGFGSDSSVPIEQDRRRSNSYDEDFVIKKQVNLTRIRDVEMMTYSFPVSKENAG